MLPIDIKHLEEFRNIANSWYSGQAEHSGHTECGVDMLTGHISFPSVLRSMPKSSVIFANTPQSELRIVSIPVQVRKLEALLREIDEYRDYPAQWDGVCTEAPDEDCLDAAQQFAKLIPQTYPLPEPSIFGGDDVTLYWQTTTHYLVVKFNKNKTIAYFYKESNKRESADEIPFNRRSLPKRILFLIRKIPT